jgi:NAD(P)-dependent dehydrogenase (short-subunit alcohol dehydrogenase family)
MKIAITGHTAGIGQALAKEYVLDEHEVVGLSQREGNNIRNIPKICDQIEPCDVFVNNAQAGYAQTELLFEMAQRWTGTKKHIVVISTMMTQHPVSVLPGLDMLAYHQQKVTLEEMVKQLRHQRLGITITIVRPGYIATQPGQTVPPAADVGNWAKTLLDLFDMAAKNNLSIPDISLGPRYES